MTNKKDMVKFDPQDSVAVMNAMDTLRKANVPRDFLNNLSYAMECYIAGNDMVQQQKGFKLLQDSTIAGISDIYDIIAIRGNTSTYLVRPLDKLTHQPIDGEQTFRPIGRDDLQIEVTKMYERCSGTIDGRDISKIMDSLDLKIRKEKQVDYVDNRIIEIMPNIFWDSEQCKVIDKIPKGRYCARRLFDTDRAGKNVVKYDDGVFNNKNIQKFMLNYKLLSERQLVEKYREDPNYQLVLDLPTEFDFINKWADGNSVVATDIILMISSMFMAEKPFGIWVLRGKARNGKSTAVGLLHTVIGTRNTTRISLNDIGDWHKYLALANTMLNAADENDDKALKDEALIKTIADHGDIELSKMREQTQVKVRANFGLVLSSNSDLYLEGKGNEAFIKRLRIIPFTHDFSAEDTKSSMRNFAEETYTPEVIAKLVGFCLGVASFFSSHPFPMSHSMRDQQEALEGNVVSYKLYKPLLEKYFSCYLNLKDDIYEDYKFWCRDNDAIVMPYDEFKSAFKGLKGKERQTAYRYNNKLHLAYKIHDGQESNLFFDDYYVPELNASIKELHCFNASVVSELEKYYIIQRLETEERNKKIRGDNG